MTGANTINWVMLFRSGIIIMHVDAVYAYVYVYESQYFNNNNSNKMKVVMYAELILCYEYTLIC